MPRAKAILQSEFPYHISARCINREWFRLPMDQVWEIFSEELFWVNKTHRFQIISFVLMSNHFHLIVRTPDANISSGMQQFMKNSSRRLTRAGNRINESFAGRHYKTVLGTHNYFLNAYKYGLLNPVKSGIVKRVELYPYSTLRGLLGLSHLMIPVSADEELVENTEEHLEWLNSVPIEEQWNAMKLGLSRPVFSSPKRKGDGRLILDPSIRF